MGYSLHDFTYIFQQIKSIYTGVLAEAGANCPQQKPFTRMIIPGPTRGMASDFYLTLHVYCSGCIGGEVSNGIFIDYLRDGSSVTFPDAP
jgi:hypothetical protein